MNFIKISESSKMKVVGDYPQSQNMSEGYSASTNDSLYKTNWNAAIQQLNLDSFVLSRKAKLTDMISSVTVNSEAAFIISDRMVHVLSKFSKPKESQLFNASIIYKEALCTNYKVLFIYDLGLEYIDFSNSLFLRKSFFDFRKSSEIQFLDKQGYLNRLNHDISSGDLNSYDPINLKLKTEDIQFDIVRISLGIKGFLVSERLAEELSNVGFTGFDLQPVNNLDFIIS
ncbi:hypothetical protein ACV07N_08430 [Roseivirga echinicomitans]